ncbi:MAG: PepSY domain-containing protein [Euzebya sp.]
MNRRVMSVVAAGALSTALIGGGVALAGGEDQAEGPDVPIESPDLERASAAALAHTGEGRVTGTEVEDEESYYEVEVTLDNGREVDVQLDRWFTVVGTEGDDPGAADDQ